MSPNKNKNSNRIMNINEPKTQFWGVCCEGGKIYSQVVKQRFYITQAVLEPDTELQQNNDEFVKVEMQRDGFSYLLCVLQHDAVYQVSLNYIFDKGEKVAFRVDGKGKVFLSGYQVADHKVATNVSSPSEGVQSSPSKAGKKPEGVFEVSSISPEKRETVQESEVVAVSKTNAETSKPPQKPVSNKAASKAFWKTLLNGTMNEDEDDNDEDYIADEDEESDSDDIEDDDDDEEDHKDIYEEILIGGGDDDDDDDDDDEEEEDEEEDDDDDAEEEEIEVSKVNNAGKRKNFQKNEAPPKRQKGLQSSNKASADSESSDSSSENEPVPKTQVIETKSAEKKKKKKNTSNISQKLPQTPQTMSQSAPNTPSAKKLQGGVEILDIRVGNGPIAKPGKILHVYYVGKLGNSTVFDSRTRGKKPFGFKLGGGQVIKGWEIGLEGMRVGGRRKIIIPPKFGYGKKHIEGIPPNSMLYFTVELEAIN